MPAFGDQGDSDTWKVVAFTRHLQQLSSSEELEMERLRSSKSPDEERENQKERGPAGTYGKFTNLVK